MVMGGAHGKNNLMKRIPLSAKRVEGKLILFMEIFFFFWSKEFYRDEVSYKRRRPRFLFSPPSIYFKG